MLRPLIASTWIALALIAGSLALAATPVYAQPAEPIDPVTGRPPTSSPGQVAPAAPDATTHAWLVYPGNPVLFNGELGSWDQQIAGVPSVLFRDGLYRMWYGGTSNGNTVIRIGYATSPDRVTWTKHTANPVLNKGPQGAWDNGYVFAPEVIFHNGLYHMWYRGAAVPEPGVETAIGYATSTDGVNWVKYAGNPVLRVGPEGSWDSKTLWDMSVLVDGTTFKMWYSGRGEGSQFQIGYATSSNGTKWKKHAGNPVLRVSPTNSWESETVYFPAVLRDGNTLEMWYSGFSGNSFSIGYATSQDGITWNKLPTNPVFWGGYGYWEFGTVIAPAVLHEPEGYRMWYTGSDPYGYTRIGYALAPPPFQPAQHGYSFANYGANDPLAAADLSLEALADLFGKDAVCWTSSSTCVVKPGAEMWRIRASQALLSGRSDAFVVTALRQYLGHDRPEPLQSWARVAYHLQLPNVRRHITTFAARQLVEPMTWRKAYALQETPATVLDTLRSDFLGEADDPMMIVLRQGAAGGHTLLPYAIEDKGYGLYWLWVYDPNYPGDTNRILLISNSSNTWSYDMGGSLGVWSGDALSHSIGAVAISSYSPPPDCPWCALTFVDRQVWLAGDGHLLITDALGRRVGYADGQFVNETPGALASIVDGGTGAGMEPVYAIALTNTLTILLDGRSVTSPTTVAVTQFGGGHVVAAEQVALTPATRDELTILADGTQATYRANQAKEVALTFVQDEEAASDRLALQGVDIDAGQAVTVRVERTGRQLVVINQPGLAGSFNLVITHYAATGVRLFSHAAIAIAAGDTLSIDYSLGEGVGPLAIRVDHGSDGSVDETIELENQVVPYYLPTIGR